MAVLEQARARGFLGPGPVVDHLRHAEGFLPFVADNGHGLDLGSGGGLPGLVLAARGAGHWSLLDAHFRRTVHLEEAVRRLGLAELVTVLTGRAEALGRDEEHRERYDYVAARSFAAPAVTAECASPFLAVGGAAVVSEPPEAGEQRWPDHHLATLGLRVEHRCDSPRLVLLRKHACVDDRFPRRVGIPAKRPLW